MIETFSDLPEWQFDITERSIDVYRVVGTNLRTRCSVSRDGMDYDALLLAAKADAREIDAECERAAQQRDRQRD